MKKQKQEFMKVRFLCLTGAVILLLTGCSIYILLTPDRTYSSQERRMLAERPDFIMEHVLNGSFQKNYETYLCEQFPGRTGWVSLQSALNRLLGNKDANGVYFGKDGYLLERYREQDIDWKQAEKNISFVAEFLKDYPQAKVIFVPVKSSVLSEKLPVFAEISGEERFFELVRQQIPQGRMILAADALHAHDSEYIYYRTDHHWTTLGAYYGYEAWAQSMGFPAVQKENFEIRQVTSRFLGTTYAKVRTGGVPDTISLYERKNGPAYQLDYNMGEIQTDSFYDMSRLEGDDPYSVFLGGNQALADIQADLEDTDGKTLLLIKDSFGNCFVPLAAGHYARTVAVDLRYVNIPVSRLLQAYPADDILILYNSVQFMEDKNIGKLK